MDPEIEKIVNAVRRLLQQQHKRFSNLEYWVLRGSLEGLPYKGIKKKYGVHTVGSLKQAGSEFWQLLSEVLGIPVSKINCRNTLREFFANADGADEEDGNSDASELSESHNSEYEPTSFTSTADLSRYKSINCIGRNQLINSVVEEINRGHQLLLISGLAGIGKTALLDAVEERITQNFDAVLRLRAEDIPTPQALCERLIHERRSRFPSEANLRRELQEVVSWLQQHRWLLVIDQTESLYKKDDFAGTLKEESAGYEYWLKRLSGDKHRSCILWVGRENPRFLRDVYAATMDGLSFADSCRLVQQEGDLRGTNEEWNQLYELCAGIPNLLRVVANWIVEHGGHQISSLLNSLQSLPPQIGDELEVNLERLSPSEKNLVRWLSLQPIAYSDLRGLASMKLSLQELQRAWESLNRRGLHRRANDSTEFHRLRPPLLEFFVASQLVESMAKELIRSEPDLLQSHPLFQPAKPCNPRSQQLLESVAKTIQDTRLANEELQRYFSRTLDGLRSRGEPNNYGAGNLINLAIILGLPLANWNLSGLLIRCADLRQANLQGCNFSHCMFQETLFPNGLTSGFKVAMSVDGSVYAVGDTAGRILVWQRSAEQVTLKDFFRLDQGISALVFAINHTLVIASGRNIYFRWEGDQEITLQHSFQVSSEAYYLCTSSSGEKLAVSSDDGQIHLWDIPNEESLGILSGHTGEMSSLAFSPDEQRIAGCDSSNQIWKWMIADNTTHQTPCAVPFTARMSSVFQTVGWRGEHLQAIEVSEGLTEFHSEHQPMQNLADIETIASACSANGDYLAGSNSSEVVHVWDLATTSETRLFNVCGGTPVELVLSDDGKLLLASTRSRTQLWDVSNQCCLWETFAIPGDTSFRGVNFQRSQGVSEIERAILQDLGIVL